MRVALGGGQKCEVSFDLRDYAAIDHGYAATVHKAQAAAADRAFVLAMPEMDRHLLPGKISLLQRRIRRQARSEAVRRAKPRPPKRRGARYDGRSGTARR